MVFGIPFIDFQMPNQQETTETTLDDEVTHEHRNLHENVAFRHFAPLHSWTVLIVALMFLLVISILWN